MTEDPPQPCSCTAQMSHFKMIRFNLLLNSFMVSPVFESMAVSSVTVCFIQVMLSHVQNKSIIK